MMTTMAIMANRVASEPPMRPTSGRPDMEWTLAGAEAAARRQAEMAPLLEASFPDPASFHDHLRGWRLGPALIARRRASARDLVRSRALIQMDDAAAMWVTLQVSGAFRGDYDGRPAEGGPGAIRVTDMGRPFAVTESQAETLELSLPREALDAVTATRDAHGLVFSISDAMAGLLAACLTGLIEAAPRLAPVEAAAAAEALGVLSAGLIGGQPDLEPPPPGASEGRLFMIARRYIDARLDSRDLTPTAVGAHLGLSRRSLYRLFDGQHGVAGYIQQRRLERAFEAIVGRGAPGASLAEIAYAHGFQSEAHFSRAFRARFGVRPGEARTLRRDEVLGAAGADRLLPWLRG